MEERNHDSSVRSEARTVYETALSAVKTGDVISAIAQLTRAIVMDEQMLEARLLRMRILLAMGDLNGAQDDLDWLVAHASDQQEVILTAARVAHAKGNDDEALGWYDRLLEMNPSHLESYKERGQIRFNRGDKKGAEEDMQQVLQLDPQAFSDITGDYSAKGVEQGPKRVHSLLNPFGI